MKGSSVFYGFKSFADKFHGQLPLNQKESSKLLTALTSSFRKHLDEVHPLKAPDEGDKNHASPSGPSNVRQPPRSSAALADNHLASLLANPLLARSTGPRSTGSQTTEFRTTVSRAKGSEPAKTDYLAAKATLEKNDAKDPIKLLEDLQKEGKATIPIAFLCLHKSYVTMKSLSADARKEARASLQPARRTLIWLLQTQRYDTLEFVQNPNFQKLLFFCACNEDLQPQLWNLFRKDVTSHATIFGLEPPVSQAQIHSWKALLLKYMVTHRIKTDPTLDAAFDLFKDAHDLVASAPAGDHMHHFPRQTRIQNDIIKAIVKFPQPGKLSAERLNQLMDIQTNSFTIPDSMLVPADSYGQNSPIRGPVRKIIPVAPKDIKLVIDFAELSLCHPLNPRPEPALKLWNNLTHPNPGPKYKAFLDQLEQEKSLGTKEHRHSNPVGTPSYGPRLHSMLMRLIHNLQSYNRNEEAEWAMTLTHRFFPELAFLNQSYLDQLAAVGKS